WALHSLPPDLSWPADEDARHRARAPLGPPPGQRRTNDQAPVPWHRVINAQGRVSTHPDEYGTRRQIELLREEGIAGTDDGELVGGLDAHRWRPEPVTVERLELPPEVLFRLDQDD